MSTRTIALDLGGDVVLVKGAAGRSMSIINGASAVAQHLRCLLRLIKGEWFLDLDAGTAFGEIIWRKGSTDLQVSTELKRVILGTDGVASIQSFSFTRDAASRTARVSFEVSFDAGGTTKINEVF